jgi:hypothetical protein
MRTEDTSDARKDTSEVHENMETVEKFSRLKKVHSEVDLMRMYYLLDGRVISPILRV